MSDLSTLDFEPFQMLNLRFSADPGLQSSWNPTHTMNPIAVSYGLGQGLNTAVQPQRWPLH